jgi:uncharacterized repeat protein (TIGR01451 family)
MTARSQAVQVPAGGLLACLVLLASPRPLLAHAAPCELIPHSAKAQEWFGYALAADGGRLAVGAPGDPAQSQGLGAAYVFRRDGTGWSQENTLPVRGGAPGDGFGTALALHGDRLAVGAPAADGAGAVSLFSRSGNVWSPESPSRIAAPEGNRGAQFGAAVALGTDALAVGAPANSAGGSFAGAVYVFPRAGEGWGPPQRLLAPDAQSSDRFGSAVAIQEDTLVVGAPFTDDLPHRRNFGAVYVFERRGGTWAFSGKLTAEKFEEDDVQFGGSVALGGGVILAGARGEDLHSPRSGANAGAAYRFTRNGSGWTGVPLHPADRQADDQLGTAVAVDGDTAMVGAPFHNVAGARPGAAFVFIGAAEREPPVSGRNAAPDSQFGGSVAVLNGDAVLLGGFRDDPGGTPDAGSVAFCPMGSSPSCNQLPSIIKSGPPGVVLPGQIAYTVVVTNRCSTALPAARVRDLFDPRLAAVRWCRADGDGACTPVPQAGRDIDQAVALPAGGTVTYRVDAGLASCATEALVNQACVSVPDRPDLGQGCAQVRNLLGVDLQVTGTATPSPVVKGHPLTVRWMVANGGDTPATGAQLLTGAMPIEIGDLGPHATREIDLPVPVPACSAGPNPIELSAEVIAKEPDCNPANNSAKVTVSVEDGTADIAVTKEVFDAAGARLAPAAKVKPGDRLTYRITVDNNIGPGTACGVVLSDRFPTGLVPVPPTLDPCLLTGECPLRELGRGASPRVLKATFEVGPVAVCPASIANTATVSTQGSTDPNSGNNASTAAVTVDEVDLAISKEGPATATAGGPLLYTIRVRNQSCHDVKGARISDAFPPELLSSSPDLDRRLDLSPGASEELQIQGIVSPLFQGTLTNTARVETPAGLADDHPENNQATVMTEVTWPLGFRLFCTGIEGPFAEGDVITCTLVLLNGGPFAQADNPGNELTDTLPAGLTLLSASADSGVASTSLNTVTWNGAIPVGGQVNITFMAKVNAGTAGTTICNQATAFLDTDGDGVNDTAFLSDLVESPGPPADPCCFRVLTPSEIPALSQVGMALLALLLAAGAVVRLRAGRVR